MNRFMSIILILGVLGCSSMFRAKYFHTSRTDHFSLNGLDIIVAKCDVDVRLCYENTQNACKGQYHMRYMTMKEVSYKWYIDRPCRRAGTFPEQCRSDGMGRYYDIREWYTEKYWEYILTSECKEKNEKQN